MLSDPGRIYYNGYTFPLYARTRISMAPVYDQAMRTLKYLKYTITVDFLLTVEGSGTVEADLDLIRRRLTQRGGELRVEAKGFPNLVVNAGTVFDVAMGPHPRIVEAQPLGSRSAWSMLWTCETNLAQCDFGPGASQGQPMAFTYNWSVRTDPRGFSTRSIGGEMEIPATVVASSRRQPDAAERYWDQIVAAFPPMPSFRRSASRDLSEDRRTLRFSITDEEYPDQSFMEGTTDWSGSQELSTSLQEGFVTWTNTLSATYTLSRDFQKRDAHRNFLLLCKQRTSNLNEGTVTTGFIPLSLSISDDLAGLSVTFTLRYTFVSNTTRQAILASGMWTDVPRRNYQEWAASVQKTVLANRGNADLAYDPATDSIIDLCLSGVPGRQPEGQLRELSGRASAYGLRATLPRPENSWVAYRASISYESDEGNYSLRTIPRIPQPPRVGSISMESALDAAEERSLQSIANSLAANPFEVLNTNPSTLASLNAPNLRLNVDILPSVPAEREQNAIQHTANADPRIRFRGRAIRLGYPVTVPRLLAAGGRQAVLAVPRYAQSVVATPGVPLVIAEWDHTYLLDGRDNSLLPLPPNPVLGVA